MALTSHVAFIIDGLTLSILVQQTLSNLLNLSTISLNGLTCRYEQLQLIVIDEISLVGARTLNVIDNGLKVHKPCLKQIFRWCGYYYNK
jgi:hypothetical protein